MSIKWKINLLFMILGVISSVGFAGYNYYEARDQVFNEAFKKAELISSFAMATRQYTVDTMRPIAREIAGAKSFHPELMGGFFVARAIAEKFAERQPGYTFKQATVNPVNPMNKADRQELEIIEGFATNPELEMKKGVLEKMGRQYFFIAKPVMVKKGCLKCHGSQDTAPEGRVSRYPGSGGYNYQAGSVAAAFINYVPIEIALAKVKSTAFKSAIAGILSVLVILVLVWFFISKVVTNPIIHLTNIADNISRGKDLKNEVKRNSKDEIGELYLAFNRLRSSVVKLIKMASRKNG